MLTSLPSRTLFPIDECQDLMADACVGYDHGELVFLSVLARDTAIQAFLARLTLGPNEQGLDRFHLVTEQDASVPVIVGNVERLDKRSTRAFRRTLFGSLVNLWLFDKRCVKPDKANATALALLPRTAVSHTERLWSLVRDTCPLPLLDHWHDTVLDLLTHGDRLTRLPLGPLDGYRLAIDVPAVTAAVGERIRDGRLTASPSEPPVTAPLVCAA